MKIIILTKSIICFFMACFIFPASAQDRIVPDTTTQIQLSFAPVVKAVSPAVVNIFTKRTVTRTIRHPFFNDPFFAPFFGQTMPGQRMRQQVENSLGSGVIVQSDGLIVTNAHVIKGADEVTVVLADGRELDAAIALTDDASDLALLRVDTKGETLPYITLKPSESLQVGDIVLAVGNPFGVGQTVTSGIVSAQGRSSLNINDFNFFIQTDAAINPGNSGGPLVSLDGGVVGINTAIYSRSGGSMGIGFAIPSEMVASVIAAEKTTGGTAQGRITRPWMGVTAQTVTADIAESLGMDVPGGALITALHEASPLKQAGLKVGDVITTVDGRKIKDPGEMRFRMATVPIGDHAQVRYIRNGTAKTVKVEAIAPPDIPAREALTLNGNHALKGTKIVNLNPAVAVEIGLPPSGETGVVVTEVPHGTPASRVVRPGDMIIDINGQTVENTKSVQTVLSRTQTGAFSMTIKTNGQIRRVFVR